MIKRSLWIIVILLVTSNVHAARCLFISSYHQGYPWADGIEQGVRSVLEGKCELRQVDMDTKRNKNEQYKLAKGNEIKDLIHQWKPDVVIAADDNASKYVVMPYFENAKIPFVFCGINWTVTEYGYPYENATGMVEVAPINELFDTIQYILPKAKSGYYLGADTLTEQKSYEYFHKVAKKNNIKLHKALSKNQQEWNESYIQAQRDDFVILGTHSGINDWSDENALQVVSQNGKKLSVTTYDWMTKFAVLGMTKVAQEQGEWAAKVAIKILEGTSPGDIPIIPNQQWDMYVNYHRLKTTKVILPDSIILKSKQVDGQ